MARPRFHLLSFALMLPLAAFSRTPDGQNPSSNSVSEQTSRVQQQELSLRGRVTTLRGSEPVYAVTVRIRIAGLDRAETLETDLRGEFSASLSLPSPPDGGRSAIVTASKNGYFDAAEEVTFGAADQTKFVELIMRPNRLQVYELPVPVLVSDIVRQSESGAVSGSETPVGRARERLASGDSDRAVELLKQATRGDPGCIDGRTLLGLALLARGSTASAMRELREAAALESSENIDAPRRRPYLILGVLETWRGNLGFAGDHFLRVLDVDPANALALQELGRLLLLEDRAAAADQYLQRAIQAGASEQARFLRARALLDESKPDEAEAEMQAYMGGRKTADLPMAFRIEYLKMRLRLRIESRGHTVSLVDLPTSELLQQMPDLKGLDPVVSERDEAIILRRVGEQIEAAFEDFPNTSSVEEVTLERLRASGKLAESVHQRFRYLLLDQPDSDGIGVEEYRTDLDGGRTSLDAVGGGVMITEGFVSQALYFHPEFQSGSRFRYLGRQRLEGLETHVFAFAQRPEKAVLMEDVRTESRATVVLVQGIAWINANTYQLVRMITDLLRPAPELRLQTQTTDVRFGEVRFARATSKFWLPRDVAVKVVWNGKIFRNRHRYSNFQLFKVEAREKLKTVQAVPETPADSQ